jgi:hypothetical protein
MKWTENRARWTRLAKSVDPSIRLYTKNHWWWNLYGGEDRKEGITAWGPFIFIPEDCKRDLELAIYHDGRHVQQMRWFGLGIHPLLGVIPWAMLLLFFLPVLFTVRFWFELDAEVYALNRKIATGSSVIWARAELKGYVKDLCGPMYLYAWPKSWGMKIAEKKASVF